MNTPSEELEKLRLEAQGKNLLRPYGFETMTLDQKIRWYEMQLRKDEHYVIPPEVLEVLRKENTKTWAKAHRNSALVAAEIIKTKLDADYGKLAALKNEETRLELALVEKPKSLATYPHELLYNIAPGQICRLRGAEYKVVQTKWDDYELYIRMRWWLFRWWKKIFSLNWRQLNGAETAAQRADALFRAYWDKEDEWWTAPR